MVPSLWPCLFDVLISTSSILAGQECKVISPNCGLYIDLYHKKTYGPCIICCAMLCVIAIELNSIQLQLQQVCSSALMSIHAAAAVVDDNPTPGDPAVTCDGLSLIAVEVEPSHSKQPGV